jgi:hypothetical protein
MTGSNSTGVWDRLFPVALGLAVVGFGISGVGSNAVPGIAHIGLDLSVRTAEAQNRRAQSRRVARRTSRRTSRRVARRHSIAGCSPYRAYYSCGGVYYRPIVENGVTVYVVVNP